jgi:hypothetical protein
MDYALPVVGLALLVVSGTGLTSLITAGRLRSPAELLSVGCLLGAGCVSMASFGLGFLFSGRTLQLAVTGLLVAIAVWGAVVWRRHGDVPRIDIRAPLPVLPTVLLVAQLAFVIWMILTQPLGWDGLLVWEMKARIACLSGGRVPLEYFADVSRAWSHPGYPLLVPLSESWVYTWAGRCDQGLARLAFPLFYVAAVGLLYAGAGLLGAGRSAVFLPPLLLPLVPAVVVQDGSVSSGYADVPLAVCYLAAVVQLLRWLRSGSADSLRLAAVLTALLPWIKTDGAVLWFSLVGVTAVVAVARRAMWPAAVMAVPGLVVLAGWMVFTHAMGARYQAFQFTSFAGMTLDRTFTILRSLAGELGRLTRWGVLWPAVAVTGVLSASRGRDPARSMLLATIVLPIVLYSAVYHFSRWVPLELHIQSSLHRLLLPSALVAVLYVATPLTSSEPQQHR